ncbi:MAG: phytanoyl-CoA dioxygenase family protein [Bacteroidota bacterium]
MLSLKEKFLHDGFLVIEDFNTAKECDDLMQRSRELAEAFDLKGHASIFQTTDQAKTSDDYFLASGNAISFFFEKDAFDVEGNLKNDLFRSLNKIGHALHDLDPVFDRFSRSPQMKQLVNSLGLDGHVIVQSMHILKHARIGGVVDVHQDSTFLYTEPDSCIGFWFALEDANVENGCMWAKPGGHQTPLRSRFRRKKGGGTEFISLSNEPFTTDGMVPLEVRKGTCIVLDGRLPHYSRPNTSGRSRQAYAIHTIDPSLNYPNENWLRRPLNGLRGF